MAVILVLICSLPFILLCSCTPHSNAFISEPLRNKIGVVNVRPISESPTEYLNIGPIGASAGVGKGAAEGALLGFSEVLYGSISNPVFIFLVPVGVLGGATYGAISGGIYAVPESTAKDIEMQLKEVISNIDCQKILVTKVVDFAKKSNVQAVYALSSNSQSQLTGNIETQQPAEIKFDSILEVGVLSIAFIGDGEAKTHLITLQVNGIAKLIDVKNNTVMYHRDSFIYRTAPRKLSEWTANSTVLLKAELETALQELAKVIVEEVFLIVRSN